MKQGYVIAIDGPAASGKGTLVQLLTVYLHGVNIYTGGMYRALALKCIETGVDSTNQEGVLHALSTSTIDLGSNGDIGPVAKIFLDGKDVTQVIRTPQVAIDTGKLVQIPGVREGMVKKQQELISLALTRGKTVIIDGQDSATNVYPRAEMKIFLTASVEERAKRRLHQYEKEGIVKTLPEMITEIQTRDHEDFTRSTHPLSSNPQHDGYFVVDTTHLTEEQTFSTILDEIKRRNLL